MAIATFDTFNFVEKLKAGGFTEAQAKAIVEAQRDSLTESITDSLATKADLKTELAEHKLDVIKWMVGLSVAQFSLLAGILIRLL